MDALRENEVKEIFKKLNDIMTENREWLIELDGAVGDGDLGITMSTGFKKAYEELLKIEEKDIGKLFIKAGMVFAQTVPSTMGTLMATGFMKGGKAIQGKEEIELNDFGDMLNSFVEGIMARGKSNPGDKTIIDSLYPAAQAVKIAAGNKKTLGEGLKLGYEAAAAGVEETKKMMSKHGRAAYYQEKSIGKQDPGATVGMLFMKAFADYAN